MKTGVVVPQINVNDRELEVVHWYVKEGDRVEKGQDIVDFGSSKATFTCQAESAGYLTGCAPKGSLVAVGSSVGWICEEKSDSPQAEAPSKSTAAPSQFSEAAKKYIEEHGLNLDQFSGLGLVTVPVIEEMLGIVKKKIDTKTFPTLSLRNEPISLSKRAEIEALTRGQLGNIISSLTVQFSATSLYSLLARQQLFGSSLQPVLLYQLSQLLLKSPLFTAFYHEGQLKLYDQVNLGIAVDLGKGLKVVTVNDAQKLLPQEFFEILTDISLRYMNQEITVEELSGSTFTVTDLSGQNILCFQPLLNQYQSAILGVGGDRSLPGSPVSLTLAFDHRVLTGREVSLFLNELKASLLQWGNAL